MQLEELHPCFYSIKNIFSEQRLTELRSLFWDKHTWTELYDGYNNLRHEKLCQLELPELLPVKDFIEEKLQHSVYANNPQLWFDYPGYVNDVHKDKSKNLGVNLQIYLVDSDNTQQGTHFLDTFKKENSTTRVHNWYSIDYYVNTGYVMFEPTQYKHGMKNAVKDHRMSLYQSYRFTEEPDTSW